MNDPWKHRSSGMRCSSCMWFVVKDSGRDRDPSSERGELGRCRRHAPTMNGFPATFEADWCGDHKLDEVKMGARQALNIREVERPASVSDGKFPEYRT